MEWNEYLKSDFKVGDKIWICDYRYNNRTIEKPIRHVKPTHVIVDSNENLPKGKRIYYSEYHFKVVKNNKIIGPFDNTGYRSLSGIAVQVFYTEQEAVSYYSKRCSEIKNEAIKERDLIVQEYNNKIKELEKA